MAVSSRGKAKTDPDEQHEQSRVDQPGVVYPHAAESQTAPDTEQANPPLQMSGFLVPTRNEDDQLLEAC